MPSKTAATINFTLVKQIAFVYLAIPVILFLFGWLKGIPAVCITILSIFTVLFFFRPRSQSDNIHITTLDIFGGVAILSLWLFFSGIGGYSFQNWDHHSRNAVFRDLINFPWPVVYHLEPDSVSGFAASNNFILSYYFGFWLPSALIGKIAGWNFANLFLFIWSLGGLLLSVILIARKMRLSLTISTLLLIFFSGMDTLGVLLLENIPSYSYPLLWPPVQHLEWWAGSLQYASFTTELFWTFNQFLPTLLILSLLMNADDSRDAIFLNGLCFFYAPIPALGAMPFVALMVINDLVKSRSNNTTPFSFQTFIQKIFTLGNLSGLLIALISILFYSTNLSAQEWGFRLRVPFLYYLFFLFVEFLGLWLLLLPEYKKDGMWYVSCTILLLAPLIKVGASWDFMMRVTLPALFVLMIGSGKMLATGKNPLVRLVLLLLLLIGALTPLYEIGRSAVRFERYYQFPYFSAIRFDDYFEKPPETNQDFVPEFDHMNTLIADEWGSVAQPNSEGWTTKVGNLFDPRYQWLLKQPLIGGNDYGAR